MSDMQMRADSGVVLGVRARLHPVTTMSVFDLLDYAPGQQWELALAQAGVDLDGMDADKVWTRAFEVVWASPGFADLVDEIRAAGGVREPVRVTREPMWQVLDGTRRIVAAARAGVSEVPVVVE